MYKISENIVIISFLLFLLKVDAQNNDQDYMRRQHSLVKPYQGERPPHSTAAQIRRQGQGHHRPATAVHRHRGKSNIFFAMFCCTTL